MESFSRIDVLIFILCKHIIKAYNLIERHYKMQLARPLKKKKKSQVSHLLVKL